MNATRNSGLRAAAANYLIGLNLENKALKEKPWKLEIQFSRIEKIANELVKLLEDLPESQFRKS